MPYRCRFAESGVSTGAGTGSDTAFSHALPQILDIVRDLHCCPVAACFSEAVIGAWTHLRITQTSHTGNGGSMVATCGSVAQFCKTGCIPPRGSSLVSCGPACLHSWRLCRDLCMVYFTHPSPDTLTPGTAVMYAVPPTTGCWRSAQQIENADAPEDLVPALHTCRAGTNQKFQAV